MGYEGSLQPCLRMPRPPKKYPIGEESGQHVFDFVAELRPDPRFFTAKATPSQFFDGFDDFSASFS